MIKLIASDMDGTLLDAKMSITNDNTSAIREAERLGIEFMVATGLCIYRSETRVRRSWN